VQIAGELRLETVAEFVESAEIAASVQALGVDYAQGFLYGRSVPLRDILAELTDAAGPAAITAVGVA
jgi:EAL domain-containing protein (putative c-di-GMP-specific phosphodiesterase class I)